MASTLSQRIFLAHLELSYRLGRRVALAEFGELIARELRRDAPFTAAAVSRWERGVQLPTLRIIEAIASVTGVDPGWISHGEKSTARAPRSVDTATLASAADRTLEPLPDRPPEEAPVAPHIRVDKAPARDPSKRGTRRGRGR